MACWRRASAAWSSAIRENEQRVEFLGYDVRLHKLVAFTIGGAWRGSPAASSSTWGNYVSPAIFSVVQSAQIIIWLMVGGAGTLLGPMLGAMALSWLTAEIGTQQVVNASVVLGAILLVFVLLVPRGRRANGDRAPGAAGCRRCAERHALQPQARAEEARHEPAADRNARPEQDISAASRRFATSTFRSPKASCVV